MKCFNCNKEMIYRDDIRSLEHAYMPYGANTNSLIVKKDRNYRRIIFQERSESRPFYQP